MAPGVMEGEFFAFLAGRDVKDIINDGPSGTWCSLAERDLILNSSPSATCIAFYESTTPDRMRRTIQGEFAVSRTELVLRAGPRANPSKKMPEESRAFPSNGTPLRDSRA